jgi:hypothetical protein
LRQHRDDPGHASRRVTVDAANARVRMRAPHDGHPEHAGKDDVVSVAAGAAQ